MPGSAGFMRLWCMPNRALKGGTLDRLSAQGQHLLDRSRERFERRADAYRGARLLTMEIGRIESVRFMVSPRLEVPTTPAGE